MTEGYPDTEYIFGATGRTGGKIDTDDSPNFDRRAALIVLLYDERLNLSVVPVIQPIADEIHFDG